ncbi:hypothetical protein [Sorangium sp. So ce131]|uniref:hypothetical protein n=1 Tax=Sorangium sp. So ce131 TaxID=3133282 RepID=UPI003F5D9F85
MLIQRPGEPSSSFQSRLRDKLGLLGRVSAAILIAAASSRELVLRSSLLRVLLGGEPLRGVAHLAA